MSRIDDDMRDRAARRAAQQGRAESHRPSTDGTSPFQKMLKFFQAKDTGVKKQPGGGALKKPEMDRKEKTRTEARKKKEAPKRRGGGQGGKPSGQEQPREQEDKEQTRASPDDDEATILEDPQEPEASEILPAGFRYNPALRAAIPVEEPPAMAKELAKEIAAKVGPKSAGELRFILAGEEFRGLSVRARLYGKHVDLLVWGPDRSALARVEKWAAAIQAALKALGYELDSLATAPG